MYAYSDDDFAAFDARVVDVLRRGITRPVLARLAHPRHMLASLGTIVSANVLAIGARLARWAFGSRFEWARRLQPPLRRWHSRTVTLQASLDAHLFEKKSVSDVLRRSQHGLLEVLINATELRTGTAFRFGSHAVGSSRHGTVRPAAVPLSLAVAASAAYPVFLPALDCELELTREGTKSRHRLVLTDGGVYDNLGVAPMEPGREVDVSAHVANVDYIIACDAGVGVSDGESIPYLWPSRMSAAFEATFRRVQNDTRRRLHLHASDGRIKGFIMPYLGQNDRALPWKPDDLILRESVVDYPTDFSAMSDDTIALLSSRGEQLTRILVAHYGQDLYRA
jgi:NTE family protein